MKRTQTLILGLLEDGPMTMMDLSRAIGTCRSNVKAHLAELVSLRLVNRIAGLRDPKKCGPVPDRFELGEVYDEDDHDQPLHKRKKGYGTNPPGEALVKAWQ